MPPPIGEGSWAVPKGLYVHVPFCVSRCSYCDFFSSVIRAGSGGAGPDSPDGTPSDLDRVVDTTIDRARSLAALFGAGSFDTVYVGGGTPSALPRRTLLRLLSTLAALAGHPREWTIEANPESLDAEFLEIALQSGVTRLSLGVQSLDPTLIAALGRPAGAERSLEAVGLAVASGLAVSADLIAGIPRRKGLVEEAERLVSLGIGHLSVYDLVLEPGTALATSAAEGRFEPLGEDVAADEREELGHFLASRGFQRYEVSNYAMAGQESLHNLGYWRMGSWLGAGPGASGTVEILPSGAPRPGLDGGSLRLDEPRSLEAYRSGKVEAAETYIEPREAAFETMMMAFRTAEGLSRRAFAGRFGLAFDGLVGDTLARWRGVLRETGDRIALRRLDLGNAFLTDCLMELERTFPHRSA